ncbi:MAG: CHAT domain-containing protein [Bacteroidaceae bacterium]|nr:CHAT domain-containing protein [Bacteroidaceae bacterium]
MTKHLLLYILITICSILTINGQTTFSIEKLNEVKSSIEKIKEEHVNLLLAWANKDNIEEGFKQDLLFYTQFSFLLNNHVNFNLELFNKCIAEQYQKKNQYAPVASLTLANLYALGNQFDNAIKHSKEVISYYENNEKKDSSYLAYANCIIGHSYIGKYEFESAYEPLKESLNYFQPKDSLDNMYSLALTNLATVESNKADFHSAYNHSKLATRLRGITFGEKSTGYAASAYTLSVSALGIEKYNEAIKFGEVVLDYYKDNAINDSINRAQIEYVVGKSYFALGNNNKACNYLINALNHFPTNLQSNNIIYANILNELGLTYRELGDYSNALPHIEKSLYLKKDIVGTDNLEYAIAMFNYSLCLSDYDRRNEALEYGEKANKLFYELKQESLYVKSLVELARYYYGTHKFDIAIEKGEEACIFIMKLFGESSHNYASSLGNLAYYYYGSGNISKAIEIENQALEINYLNQDKEEIAESLEHLGKYHNEIDQYEKAIEYYEKSSNIKKVIKGINHPDYLSNILNLSRCYRNIGNYSKAIYYAEEYAPLIKNIYGETSNKYAIALENLSSCYGHIGDLKKDSIYMTKALYLKEKNKDENSLEYAISLANTAMSLYNNDKIEEALKTNQKAITILRQYELNHSIVPLVNNIEYKVANKLYEESLQDISKTIKLIEKNTFLHAQLLYFKSYCLQAIDNFEESIIVNNEALELVEKLLGDSHPYNIRLLELQKNNNLIIGNDSLFIHYLQKENSSIRNYMEEQLYTFTETDRSSVYNIIRQFYDDVADYIFITNYKKEIKDILFNGVLMTKGLLLDLQKSLTETLKDMDGIQLQKDLAKLSLLKNEYNKSIKLMKNNADSIYANMRNIERKILQENKERLSVSNYSVSWKDVQNNLSANEVAIEFINYPYWELDNDSIIYAALVIRKEWKEPTFVALKKESVIRYHYYNQTDSVKNISNNSPLANFLSLPIISDNEDELYQCIWTNIVTNNLIKPGDNIYFSASGILHQIPIESLPIGNGKIMSDVYNMHRLSSTRELVKKKKGMKYTKAALYGGLNYDMTDDELLSASQTYTKDASTEYFVSRGLLEDSIRGYKWDNLSNTQQEVDYISDLMKKNQITTQTYKGNQGNEESFKTLSGHEYNIIHLATHGFFYPDEEAKEKDYFKPMLLNNHYQKYNEVDMSMWRSGLVLSGGNRAWKGDSIPDTVEDGILKAQEIGDLDLRGADLVVLSACNTGQGEVTGEGVFGLQRAFKMAGAQTIVMSLTPVDDQTTMAMMNKFYTNLFSGQSKHDAFYNAQRYIRSIKPDPKYWMGWIMLD